MTYSLILRPETEEDILDAYRWYDGRVSGLGLRFLESVERALTQIEHNPQAFPAVYEGVRRVLIQTFPYGIYFSLEGERCVVLAVVHSSRHPRVWMERTRIAP